MDRYHAESNVNILLTDKKSSFWLWRQAVKPFFNDTIELFVG